MQKNMAGRPSSGIPRKRLSLMFNAADYWEIYDRAKSSGKSISHFIVDSILSDWRYKKPTPRLTPRDRTAVVTDLEKAVMTNSITNVKEALSLYAGDSDMLFASGRVKCIYKDNICR